MPNSKALEKWENEKAELGPILEAHPGIIAHLREQDPLLRDVLQLHYGVRYYSNSELADILRMEPASIKQRIDKIRKWLGIGNDSERMKVLAHGPPPIHFTDVERRNHFNLRENPALLGKLGPQERQAMEHVIGLKGFGLTDEQAALKMGITENGFKRLKWQAYAILGWGRKTT